MKVVIQNCHSEEYFAGGNQWVREPERAVAFSSSVEAMEYMYEGDLHPAKVVLKFADKRYDVDVAKTADC